jgi:phosphoenolpyruvate carboxylase
MMDSNSYDFQVNFKYEVYNSIFLTLDFATIKKTGLALPSFSEAIKEGLQAGKDPKEIVRQYFEDHHEYPSPAEQHDLLFRIIQYVERQVVLIDALEETASPRLNELHGSGTLQHLVDRAKANGKEDALREALNDFRVKIVLTAHPTQFYPGTVLGIINDLSGAFRENDLYATRILLEQLGQTPFFVKEKPSPYDEAVSLGWYLENIFYHAIPKVIAAAGADMEAFRNFRLLEVGFWPGGDRDGNPYVTAEITQRVSRRLKFLLLKAYYNDVRALKRRLTFRGLMEKIEGMEETLRRVLYDQGFAFDLAGFQRDLEAIKEAVAARHNGFCIEMVENLLLKTRIFGQHFSSLDIRQDSRVIGAAFEACLAGTAIPGIGEYFKLRFTSPGSADPVVQDVLEVFSTISAIQQESGELACHRFIISNCRSAENVLQVYALAANLGMGVEPVLDIVPLFETIDDLQHARGEMDKLYACESYRAHLSRRGNRQYIMLGFSDGTKDGGYFAANWHIFKAKERLTAIAEAYNLEVVFFDGRGGPPARGGGNVRKYYAAQGRNIGNKEIQITIQGQTVSSRFSSVTSAVHFLENLLTAGIENRLFGRERAMDEKEELLMQQMAEDSFMSYVALRKDEAFLPFLEQRSPLRFFGRTNIGSRPSKRGGDEPLTLEDLRAIPFVGSWSAMKLNVPGYYGLGKALEEAEAREGIQTLKDLFANNAFFESLISNSMQSISKTRLDLTGYLQQDAVFGKIWDKVREENERSRRMIAQLLGETGWEEALGTKASIALREEVVLPLLVIQQYALMQLEKDPDHATVYETLIIRTLYGIINAARNSA